jgi:predicted nuclease of restriction endonuclease-like (RecB) superfamily
MNELTPKLTAEDNEILMVLLKETDKSMWHESNLSLSENERKFAHSLEVQNLREKLTKKGIVKEP